MISAVNPRIISAFEVQGLFGLYDYRFELGKDPSGNGIHESLLYGDNGTGKTTLLRLMYHALSKKKGDGSRTFIARTPFNTMSITLGSGHRIEITKSNDKKDLKFSIHLGTTTKKYILNPDEGGTVNHENSPALDPLIAFLKELDVEQLYLSDDRRIITTYEIVSDDQERRRRLEEEMAARRGVRRPPSDSHLNRIDLGLLADRVKEIIRDKLIARSLYGRQNVNNIYINLAKQLATAKVTPVAAETNRLADFEERIRRLANEYAEVVPLQIFPEVQFDQFVQITQQAGEGQRANIIDVLGNYLDTIEAQLNAVRDLARLLNSLLAEVNAYLVHKKLTFSIIEGFGVVSTSGVPLKFTELSSGERQLLFLLLISFVTRDEKSIVYIDEPELSLNIKWQRQLISSILGMVKNTETQLIIATHSFEVLTMHSDAVINLNEQFTNAP